MHGGGGDSFMSSWNFVSQPDAGGNSELTIAATEDDMSGAIVGSATLHGATYQIKGQWVAKGSVTGRNDSVFWLGGSTTDAAPILFSAVGELNISVVPNTMTINVSCISSADGVMKIFSGKMTSQ
jgi:hypothetical protein